MSRARRDQDWNFGCLAKAVAMEVLAVSVAKIVLFGLSVFAFVQGRAPERCACVMLLGTFIAKELLTWLGFPINYFNENPEYMFLSVIMFFLSLGLAVAANRIWPLFFSALALVQVTGHLSVMAIDHGQSRAYWVMTQVPIIGQVAVIMLGVFAATKRAKIAAFAPDWRDRAKI